jgi:hypothetical protein
MLYSFGILEMWRSHSGGRQVKERVLMKVHNHYYAMKLAVGKRKGNAVKR